MMALGSRAMLLLCIVVGKNGCFQRQHLEISHSLCRGKGEIYTQATNILIEEHTHKHAHTYNYTALVACACLGLK